MLNKSQVVPSGTRTRMKLTQGEIRDEISTSIYDTIKIEGGEQPIGLRGFFSSVQGKPTALTNLRQNNILESGVSFRILAMGAEGSTSSSANWRVLPLIAENSVIKLHIGEKEYFAAPLWMAAGKFEMELLELVGDQSPIVATNHISCYQRYGKACTEAINLGSRHAIDIGPLQSFRVEMETSSHAQYGLNSTELLQATPDVGTSIKIAFFLKGLLRRPVQ